MICPYCRSRSVRKLNRTTDLGYRLFRCGDCRRKSNERTGTPFNYLEFPTDIVFEIVLCRLRYKLSLRNLGTLAVVKELPKQVTTDGHCSYPGAIREVLGRKVNHRCSAYLNRRIEQDHRGIKQRYHPMLGFGALHSARRFCRAFEKVRQYFRPRRKRKQVLSLAHQRREFLFRAQALRSMFIAA